MANILTLGTYYFPSPEITTAFILSWTEVTNTSTNQSELTWNVVTSQTPTGSGYKRTLSSGSVTINGTAYGFSTGSVYNGLVVASNKTIVNHEADGKKTIAVSMTANVGGDSKSANTTATLSNIPRASTFEMSTYSANANTANLYMYITPASSTFTHQVEIQVNGVSKGTWTGGSGSSRYQCPTYWNQANLQSYCGTNGTTTMMFYLYTYSNGTFIGGAQASVIYTGNRTPLSLYQDTAGNVAMSVGKEYESTYINNLYSDLLIKAPTGVDTDFLVARATEANKEFLRLNTERSWGFLQQGTGAQSALVLKSNNGDKSFYIENNLETKAVVFYASENYSVYPNSSSISLGTSNLKWGQIYSTSSSISTSDRNMKKYINDISDKYEAFYDKLKPSTFKFRTDKALTDEPHAGRTHTGFISQDVEESLTESGLTAKDFAGFCKDLKTERQYDEDEKAIDVPVLDKDGNEQYMYSLRYEEFIALNTWQIQKLKARVKELEMLVKELKETVND